MQLISTKLEEIEVVKNSLYQFLLKHVRRFYRIKPLKCQLPREQFLELLIFLTNEISISNVQIKLTF